MSVLRMRVFSTAFKVEAVRRLEGGEALAKVSRELGIARKLLYEWRSAWRREGVGGLNRKRGPKPGGRRRVLDRPRLELGSGNSAVEAATPAGELQQSKARIAELERTIGRQQVDLDFFRKALRLIDAPQPGTPPRGAVASTRSSKR
jgi:transposase